MALDNDVPTNSMKALQGISPNPSRTKDKPHPRPNPNPNTNSMKALQGILQPNLILITSLTLTLTLQGIP